jgi:hypothetical protein
MEEKDILFKLADLYQQATTEHSHYYTADILAKAMIEISKLRAELASCKWWKHNKCPKCKEYKF